MMKNTYFDLKENQLIRTANLTLKVIEMDKESLSEEQLEEKIVALASTIAARVTIIDRDGAVIADSEDDHEQMENHSNRPEFQQVINENKRSGLSIRYSNTLGYSMMYVAIPVVNDQQITGVIRTSLTLQEIEQAIQKLWISIALVLFTAFY
ncbi:hypothetical protein ACI2OX_05530 [Bacillus sp. N9]